MKGTRKSVLSPFVDERQADKDFQNGKRDSRNECAADTETAVCGALRPNRFKANADRRKNWDVQYRQNILRELFLRVQFDGHATETKIEYARAACALVAERGIGIGAGHGNAFCFSLNGVAAGRWALGSCWRRLRRDGLGLYGGRWWRFGAFR